MAKICTIVYGDEDFLLDRARDSIAAGTKLVLHRLDGEGMTGKDLVSILGAGYLTEGARLFLIDNANEVKTPAPAQKFFEGLAERDYPHQIVAVVRSSTLTALWEAAAKVGASKLYAKPAPWKTSEQVSILRGEVARVGLEVEDRLLEALVQQVGWELGVFAREFAKLAVLLGPRGKITQEALLKVTSLSKQAEPWAVADALAARRKLVAMDRLSSCYKANGDQCLVPVVVTAMRHFEKLAVVKSMQDKGASEEAIAARVGMHPFRCKQTLLPNAARFSRAEVADALQMLCRLDTLVKGSARSKRTHVELALLQIAS